MTEPSRPNPTSTDRRINSAAVDVVTPDPARAGVPTSAHAPMVQLTPQQTTFALIGLLLGVFLAALDQTIVATAAPIIQKDLNISNALYPWLTTIYLLSSTVMVPVWGKLSDLYGRKNMLLAGIGVFLLGSVMCGFSQDGIQLIISRGVQGLGSAALFTVALSIIADIFAPEQRAKFSGLFGMLFGISSIVGPLVGGYLTDNISWHWIFFVNVPLGALAIYFIVTTMPALKRDWGGNRPGIDWAGVFWLFLGTIPLLVALSLGKNEVLSGESGFLWTSWQILSMFALSLTGIIAFIATERRVKEPLVNLELFKNKSFAWGTAAAFVAGSAFLAAIVFLPFFMVNVVGLSATSAGLTTLPLTFGLVLGNIFSGQLAARIGKVKPIILSAMVVLLIGFALMGFTLTSDTSQFDVGWKMFLVGVGLGPTIPLFTLAVQNAVQPRDIGGATALVTFSRSLGTTIGVAVLGSVFATVLGNSFASGRAEIVQSLPLEQRSQFASLNAPSGGGEGGASGNFDLTRIKKQAEAGIAKQFAAQYSTLERAINSGSIQAFQALKTNPQLPEQLRANLERIPAVALSSEAGRTQVLEQIKTNLDTAQTATVSSTSSTLNRVGTAFKQAATDSVTSLYKFAILLVLLAFIVTLLMPEAPFRRGNPTGARPAPAVE